jgi:hypothetical protein
MADLSSIACLHDQFDMNAKAEHGHEKAWGAEHMSHAGHGQQSQHAVRRRRQDGGGRGDVREGVRGA